MSSSGVKHLPAINRLKENTHKRQACSRRMFGTVLDGEIILGEAKKNGKLDDKELRKYLQVAERIGAKKLVFATLAPNWSLETQNRIENMIRGTEIKPIILRNSDLLSGQ